jgi:hypothetical protein
MSAEISIKPVSAPVFRDAAAPSEAREGAARELPASKSVTPAAKTEMAANQARNREASLSRQTLFDRAAAELVFRVVDQRTNIVVRQIPEEQTLKMRSYRRALDNLIAEQTMQRRINREV